MSRKLPPWLGLSLALLLLLGDIHEAASDCGVRQELPNSNWLLGAMLASRERIIGGRESPNGRWPWHALITYINILDGQTYYCGGSLVSQQHILTAAHCAVDMDPSRSAVLLGSIDAKDASTGVVRRITRVIIHSDYSDETEVNPTQLNDIALLVLNEPVEYSSSIQPVCLSNDSSLDQRAGALAYVIGFGAYDQGGQVIAHLHSTLLETSVPLIPRHVCSQRWRPLDDGAVKKIDESQLCAGSFGHGTAQGDSGGELLLPLHGRWFQVGITSFGLNTDEYYLQQDAAPGVYTRVSSFCAWINEHSGGVASCVSPNDLPAASATRSILKFFVNLVKSSRMNDEQCKTQPMFCLDLSILLCHCCMDCRV